ncbi:MAG: TerC family protein [Betaproteobacteria bacterium]|nr:TerC family protein [Betaproteobacteria bacterium]
MPDFANPEFWVAVAQIIAIDIVLSGDNAVVIALACRNLPPHQKRVGIFWGVVGAVSLRVVLTAFAASLLGYPWLKLVGGLLLLWIGVKLLLPEGDDGHEIQGASHVAGAVRTIIVADFVMSLDNVIAVAAASRDSIFLLIFGLAVSIPLIVWTSQLIMKLMERFPVVILLGAALLGYVAGGMIAGDLVVREWLQQRLPAAHYVASVAGALFVVALGRWLALRRAPSDYPVV